MNNYEDRKLIGGGAERKIERADQREIGIRKSSIGAFGLYNV